MHRHFAISVPSGETDGLLDDLQRTKGVVSVAVHRGASVQPPGDVVSVDVLNRASEDVLVVLERARDGGSFSLSSSQVSSLVDLDHVEEILNDSDETTWEDAESALRNHAQLTVNFVALMVLGGVIAACGLFSLSYTTQATALVAAAVIAPGFEPLAQVGLGLVLRQRRLLLRALRSVAVGYLVLVAAGAATMLVIRATPLDLPARFIKSSLTAELADPTTVILLLSACGALAGSVMIAAHRVTLLAGPLIALQLIPAAVMSGMALGLGDGGLAAEGLVRLGIDVGMVVVAALLVFGVMRVTKHRRQPLM